MEYTFNIKEMTISNYAKVFNEALYPLIYPYYLRAGLREEDSKKSITIQVGIPKDKNLDNEDWDIDSPTEYSFKDLITLYGDTDKEVINLFEELQLVENLKRGFRSF
jgi:hypothetical protein